MYERLSLSDDSLIFGYAMHIQRYEFALEYCVGKNVLDAGCGTGFGPVFLANRGAASVVGVDIAPAALEEATRNYRAANLRFLRADLEAMDGAGDLPKEVDVIVNLENIEHLKRPEKFLASARQRLARPEGVLITSTPNGELTERDEDGNLINPYHVHEYSRDEFVELLTPYFSRIDLFGQWETIDAKARKLTERRIFEQLCESYYNPIARVGRLIKRLLGKRPLGPPEYTGAGTSFSWEYTIQPLDQPPFLWRPDVLLAVCS